MLAPVLRAPRTPMDLVQVDLDEPKANEVRVRMTASGVCHSCLHVLDGSVGGAPMPIVLGDEGAGVVVSVGPGVDHVRPGDHVIISGNPGRNAADHRLRMRSISRPSDGWKWSGTFE